MKTLLVTDEFGNAIEAQKALLAHLQTLGLGKISKVLVNKQFSTCSFMADGCKMYAYISLSCELGQCYYEFKDVAFAD